MGKGTGLRSVGARRGWALVVVWMALAVCCAARAGGKPPKDDGGKEREQDIPLSVVVHDPLEGIGVWDDGDGAYVDNKKAHVLAVIGGRDGQFAVYTNTNEADGGRTLIFMFGDPIEDHEPEDAPPHLLQLPGPVAPLAVEIFSARPDVGAEGGYVDLRAIGDTDGNGILDPSEEENLPVSANLAVRLRLIVTDLKNHYCLNFGDILWPPTSPKYNPLLNNTDLILVTRTSATTWTLETQGAERALLDRIVGGDWNNRIPVGIFAMPVKMTATILEE